MGSSRGKLWCDASTRLAMKSSSVSSSAGKSMNHGGVGQNSKGIQGAGTTCTQARRSLETSNREREREIRYLKETTGTGDRRVGEGEGDRSFERSLETGET